MMKHPALRWLGLISWLVTALVAINVGLVLFNYDFFKTDFAVANLSSMMVPIYYLILGSGILSLVLFGMAMMNGCGNCKCK